MYVIENICVQDAHISQKAAMRLNVQEIISEINPTKSKELDMKKNGWNTLISDRLCDLRKRARKRDKVNEVRKKLKLEHDPKKQNDP